MPLKCIKPTARTCKSFSSEMSSDLFPAPTMRRCASQRAPRSPNSNGEQVLRLTGSCHSLWASSSSTSSSSYHLNEPPVTKLKWWAGLVIHRDHHHLPPENRSWLVLQLLGQFVNVKPIKWMIIVKIIIKWMIIVKMIATGCQKKEDCSRDKQRATKAEVTIVSFLNKYMIFLLTIGSLKCSSVSYQQREK